MELSLKDFIKTEGTDVSRIEELVLENEKVYLIPTSFNFIKTHKGLRPKCLHLLLGQTGHGKTTLFRSIIKEHLEAGIICGYYLSEESGDQILTQYGYRKNLNKEMFKYLYLMEERKITIDREDYLGWINLIKSFVLKNKCKVLFIDNLTTSEFYDQKIRISNNIINCLRDMARELDVAIFIIMHSNSDVFNNQVKIDPQQVRGSKSSVNKSEYLYTFIRKTMVFKEDIFQSIPNYDQELSFVEVVKSRGHAKESASVYQLNYDKGFKEYCGDERIDWDKYLDKVVEGRKKK